MGFQGIPDPPHFQGIISEFLQYFSPTNAIAFDKIYTYNYAGVLGVSSQTWTVSTGATNWIGIALVRSDGVLASGDFTVSSGTMSVNLISTSPVDAQVVVLSGLAGQSTASVTLAQTSPAAWTALFYIGVGGGT